MHGFPGLWNWTWRRNAGAKGGEKQSGRDIQGKDCVGGEVAEVEATDASAGGVGGAVVDEKGGGGVGGGEEGGEGVEVFGEGGVEGARAFDFDGDGDGRAGIEDIDLKPFGVAGKIEIGFASRVGAGFEKFGDDEILEEIATEGVAGELCRGFDAQKPSGEADIGEVKLGGFDEALADIGEPGGETEDDKRGFCDGEPLGDGGSADTDFAGEGVAIDELSDAAGEEMEKFFEGVAVADFEDCADVAFDVSAEIVAVEVGGGRGGVKPESGEESSENEIFGGKGVKRGRKLGEREGEKVEFGGTSGEGLGDGFAEAGLVAARENETAVAGAVGVDENLDAGKEFGNSLDFVEEQGFGVNSKKGFRVFTRQGTEVGIFQIDVGVGRKKGAGKGGFSGLART